MIGKDPNPKPGPPTYHEDHLLSRAVAYVVGRGDDAHLASNLEKRFAESNLKKGGHEGALVKEMQVMLHRWIDELEPKYRRRGLDDPLNPAIYEAEKKTFEAFRGEIEALANDYVFLLAKTMSKEEMEKLQFLST